MNKSNAEKGGPVPYTVVSDRCALMKIEKKARQRLASFPCSRPYSLHPFLPSSSFQGLALTEQIIDEVPVDTFDLPLDAIVTPDTVYYRR